MLNLNQSILDACVAKSKLKKRAVTDIRPYFVVENKGFKNMVKVLEPHYELLSHTHFSMKIWPGKYQNCRLIIQGILCCPHHRWVDLQSNGKLRDCDCSPHHKGVGDAKSGATDTPPL
jgi:hypothetical protein